ncbi:MAG TPA: 30S ribosomal protein S6 [Longimicrobiales bacterium]|nr:30S ribosomal protein S6 [Longimicrobiales bacterium]
MRTYELVYIFDTTLTEDQVGEKLEKFTKQITSGGGEITAVDQWGKRQLAYPIRKKTSGNYVVVQFTSEVDGLPELERNLKLDEDLMRYLIVLNEGEPTAPMSIATREPRDDDDDEDGDDDEEEED